MSNLSLSKLTRGVLAIGVLASASFAANAAPVLSPLGSPFPVGSSVTLSPGFNVDTFYVPSVSLSNFVQLPGGFTQAGSTQQFTFSADFDADFYTDNTLATSVGHYHGSSTNFQVNILSRNSLFSTGVFNAVLNTATFNGFLGATPIVAQLNPTLVTNGTANFTGSFNPATGFQLFVDTTFGVNAQYSVNGGPFQNLPPLAGNSTPPPAVPEPATLALLAPGLLALGARRRAKRAN